MTRNHEPSILASTARTAPRLALAGAVALLPEAAAAAEGGLEIFPDPVRLIVLIAFFALLIWPVQKLLFQPLLRVLDERGERIEGARRQAEELSRQADDVIGRYETNVRAARVRAEEDRRHQLDGARREESRLTGEARADAEAELARVRRDVGQALDDARTELRSQAEQLAREAASQVLGRAF